MAKRRPDQIFVLYSMESPANDHSGLKFYNGEEMKLFANITKVLGFYSSTKRLINRSANYL